MIAEIAAGAGHELNSPLTVISGRAQMLQRQTGDPEMKRSLETIYNKAHECSTIVTELMDFARPRTPQFAAVDLAALLAEVRDEVLERSSLPPSQFRMEIADEDGAPLPPARADHNQIKSVFHELIENAEHAVAAADANITVRCRRAPSGDALEVTVRDNGCGMSPAVLQRAFDPFYSHRDAGRSRGLGLARVHRIVEAHGGRIWFESRTDEGTTAYVLVPMDSD
jgi:signal transduction histidine kinase